jgi:hypothetical protein
VHVYFDFMYYYIYAGLMSGCLHGWCYVLGHVHAVQGIIIRFMMGVCLQ